MTTEQYQNIRVVLVNTSHPGNIGGVARAMKNMCLGRLYVVDPQTEIEGKARARAAGALDVLESATIVKDFNEAIADCSLVIGASARLRAIPWPTVDPHECAKRVAGHQLSEQVALVFGREDTGLTNEELEKCNVLLHIPANEHYSSLNIAAAVQVVTYEIHMAFLAANKQHLQIKNDQPLANAQELEGLYQHLETTLASIGFYDPNNPKQLLRRLRRLYNRAMLDRMEVNILRGILSAMDDKLSAK